MNFYMKCRLVIMRDYLGDSVICIVPYRRLYGSRILCVREVFIVCTLYYVGIVLRLGCLYYVIWTFHVFKSLYYFPVTLVVLVCCSLPQPLDYRLSLSPLYSPTRTMYSTTRERKSV